MPRAFASTWETRDDDWEERLIGLVVSAQILVLLALFVLIVRGGGLLRAQTRTGRAPRPPGKVRCIVPAAGAEGYLAASIRSLLNQDYPDYEIVFVTDSARDPASAVIRDEIARAPHARLVHSGRASKCAQKNHNLLRGLQEPPADSEIVVFCDSTRIARPDWLTNLVAPVASGEAALTSGYHHALPLDGRLATLGRACSVLLLFLTKGFSNLNQPWGGATALRTKDLERLEVPALWARKVVDDVSLAAHLARHRIRTALSPRAALATPVDGETLSSWNRWLIRQWLYLKFCMPGAWAVAGIACYAASALLVLSALWCALGIAGLANPALALASACFLACLAGLGRLLMRYHPAPGSGHRWTGAFFATLLLAGWSHMETLLADCIDWKGIRYRVAWGGDVTEITEIREPG